LDARSDHSLVRRFRDGEQDAATALYCRYARRLQQFARRQISPVMAPRFDPEDVVQSVFRTFFRRAQTGCYNAPPGDELWQLLLVLALNKVRTLATHHRAGKRDVSATVQTELHSLSQLTNDSQHAAPLLILRMVIDEVLHEMPAASQQIVVLRIDGCLVPEIAEKTDRSKRTVERVLQNFRQRLAKLINDG
jgi:RNA polymerase sigma-70 factor (ECF subfamily)